MLVPPGPHARAIQRRARAAVVDWHHVRISDAVAVDEVVSRNVARPQHGKRGSRAAETRATLRNPMGNFRIGLQLDQRRRPLSLLRIWRAHARTASSG